MTGRTATMRVADLVEDLDLYPRRQVDSSNTRDLADALRTGATLPKIVIDEQNRVIDGIHRTRAYLRVYGPDHVVPVDVRSYTTEAEAFQDAVALNRVHGRKLNSNDLIKSARRLQEMGVDDKTIEAVIRIPMARVEQLSVRIALTPAGDPVPLKGGDVHLKGHEVTPAQVAILDRRLGVSYGRLARQLVDGARGGLFPNDDSFWEVLVELRDVLDEALEMHAQERIS